MKLFPIFNSYEKLQRVKQLTQKTKFDYVLIRTGLYANTCLTLYDGCRYHKETSLLICSANQWTGFHMITASVMKELTLFLGF